MHRMLIGNTGIEVLRLGLGGIPLQRITEKEAIQVVSYAIEKGIDFIDTARNYTVSESRIGKAMELAGKRVAVSSKSFDRTADGVRRDIEKSMKELKVNYIDFYHCHSVATAEDYKRVTAKDGALTGLLKAKEEGVIGHTGVSSYNVEVMEKIADDNLFETIMVGFNIVEPIAYKSVIPKAMENKRGIFIMKPLAGGVIGIPELALRWVFSFPGMIVITGMESKEEVDKNLEILEGSYGFTDDEKQQIIALNRQFASQFCHRCLYCEPCTVNIPIYKILSIKNMVRIHGSRMLTSPDFEDTLERAKNCIQCNDCLIRCPYNLPIPFMMKELVKWADYERSRVCDAMY